MSADGFIAFCQRCNASNVRGLVLLSGERTAVQQAALLLLAHQAAYANERVVCDWIADDLPANSEPSRQYFRHQHRAKAQQLLGSDLQQVVIDTYDGLSPNLLGIVSGALCGGGLLFLLTPPLQQWPEYSDPDYARFSQNVDADKGVSGQLQGGFLRRFTAMLAAELSQLSADAGLIWSAPVRKILHWTAPSLAMPQMPVKASIKAQLKTPDKKDALRPSPDQLLVVDQVKKIVTQPSAALLLTADRGRGKTTALGFAVSALLCEAKKTEGSAGISIVLCAPIKANVQHALDVLANRSDGSAGQQALKFLPPDKLLSDLLRAKDTGAKVADLIIVDEAAAIAMPVLHKISKLAPRLVFTSTTAGYEGSGRGFILRFKALLEQQFKTVEHITLTAPVRWSSNDLMEPFFNQLLCLADSSLPTTRTGQPTTAPCAEKIEIVALSKEDLLGNEAFLQAVFTVLVNAHYQTRPDDLRYLLDTPYTRLWIARNPSGDVMAALLLCEEGGMSGESLLLDQIASGKRRPRGNMLAQLLSYQTKNTDWCELRSWRVMRIAVLTPYRRQGIARRLIAAMELAATKAGCSYWGSLFGFDAGLTGFWQRNNTVPVHLGLHLDKASAARNIAVVRLLPAGKDKLRQSIALLVQRLAANVPVMGRNYYIELSPNERDALGGWATPAFAGQICSPLIEDDLRQLQRFIDGELGVDSIYASLYRLLQNSAAELQLCNSDGLLSQFLDCAPNWQRLTELLPNNGQKSKRAVQQLLRARIETLYAAASHVFKGGSQAS